jgi:SAM-dependent methyltransferase
MNETVAADQLQPVAPSAIPAQVSLAPHRLCPICNADNGARSPSAWSRVPWVLKECGQCDFLYLENPPPASDFSAEFAWERTHAQERARRQEREPLLVAVNAWRSALAARLIAIRRGGKIVRWIDRYVGSGRLLDVGCGHGMLLSLTPPRIVPYGVEISTQLAAQANRLALARGGYVVEGAAATALSLFSNSFFDGIVMRCYLEHEVDPAKVLRVSSRILRPGGVLIVKVPNFDCWNRRIVRGARWCGFRHPDHVNYFTPRSLTNLVRAHGFEIARFRFADRLATNDNMWLVARKTAD